MAFSPQPLADKSGLYRPLADINVTPLVDVMLVLLIIFMVTAPMLATGLKINLPQAKAAQPVDPKDPIVITVAKDGKLSLGHDAIDKTSLIAAVQTKLNNDLSRVIHLRGDKQAAYGDVVAIMDLLATNGMTHIAILADTHATPDVPEKPDAPAGPTLHLKTGAVTPILVPTIPRSAPSSGARLPISPTGINVPSSQSAAPTSSR